MVGVCIYLHFIIWEVVIRVVQHWAGAVFHVGTEKPMLNNNHRMSWAPPKMP
jgi:hypothetical protein